VRRDAGGGLISLRGRVGELEGAVWRSVVGVVRAPLCFEEAASGLTQRPRCVRNTPVGRTRVAGLHMHLGRATALVRVGAVWAPTTVVFQRVGSVRRLTLPTRIAARLVIRALIEARSRKRMASTLSLKVFLTGRVAVKTDGAMIDEAQLGGRQGRLLFAYLVAERSRPVPRDELAEALWGETPPATRDKALTVIASKLRGARGRRTRRPGAVDCRLRLLSTRPARADMGRPFCGRKRRKGR
jgi:hypothetical protein